MAILHQEESRCDREGRIAQLHQEKRTDELLLTEWGDPHEGVDESGVARGLESSIAVYPAVAEVMPLREGPPRKHLESEVEGRGHAHHYGGELESPSEPEGGYRRAPHQGARVSGEDPSGIPVELQEAQIGDHEQRTEESEGDFPLPPAQEGKRPDRDRRVARLQPVEPRQHVAEVRRSGDREGDDEERVERTEGDETKEGEGEIRPSRKRDDKRQRRERHKEGLVPLLQAGDVIGNPQQPDESYRDEGRERQLGVKVPEEEERDRRERDPR